MQSMIKYKPVASLAEQLCSRFYMDWFYLKDVIITDDLVSNRSVHTYIVNMIKLEFRLLSVKQLKLSLKKKMFL